MFRSRAIAPEPFRVTGIWMTTLRRWAMPEPNATRVADSNVLGDAQLVQLARLADRLRSATVAADACWLSPVMVGAWARIGA